MTAPSHPPAKLVMPAECLYCRYPLADLGAAPCPECGVQPEPESPRAEMFRVALGRFGGGWRLARIIVWPMMILALGDFLLDFFWGSWELFELVRPVAFTCAFIGIVSLIAGAAAASRVPKRNRVVAYCAFTDSAQWLLLTPLIFLPFYLVTDSLSDWIPSHLLQVRYNADRESFENRVVFLFLLGMSLIGPLVMRNRAIPIVLKFGADPHSPQWRPVLWSINFLAKVSLLLIGVVGLLTLVTLAATLVGQWADL